MVFLDLAQAFDKVRHNLLVHKLKENLISEEVAKWTEDWLDKRVQRVVLNGEESEWEEVESGII